MRKGKYIRHREREGKGEVKEERRRRRDRNTINRSSRMILSEKGRGRGKEGG